MKNHFKNILLMTSVCILFGMVACNNAEASVSDNGMDILSEDSVSEDVSSLSISGNGCYYTVSGDMARVFDVVQEVSEDNISDEVSEEIVWEPEYYTLEELDAMNFSGYSAEQVLDLYAASDIEDVTFINLNNRYVNNVTDLVHKIEQFPNLTQVDMCDCGISNEQMNSINESIPDVKVVWMIRVKRWAFRTDVVAFSTYQPKEIWTRLDNDDMQLFKYCHDLLCLDIGHNSVSDYSFLEYLPNLRILIIADNFDTINGGYVKDLDPVRNCKELRYFEFFISNVKDVSFLEELTELRDLNLCYTPVQDVNQLCGLPHLERLWLNCCGISADEYAILAEAYPDTEIMYRYAGSTDQGWREHSRYYAMRDSFRNNYLNEQFTDEYEQQQLEAAEAAEEID